MKLKSILLFTLLLFLSCVLQLNAKTLDLLDTASDWDGSSDGSASGAYGNTTSTTVVPGVSSTILAQTFDFTNGSWVQISKDFSHSNLSDGDSIQLYYRGTGSKNNIELKFIDSDGDIFNQSITGVSNAEAWTSGVFAKTGFSLWADSNGLPLGNGTRNWDSIAKFEVVLTANEGGSGTFEFDEVSLYQVTSPGNVLIDQCNSTITNDYGGNVGSGKDASYPGNSVTLELASTNPSPEGGTYLKSTYNMEGGWMVCAEEGFRVGTSSLNAVSENVNYLNFYMRVEDGTERPRLEVWYDNSGSEHYDGDSTIEFYGSYDDRYGAVSTDWQLIQIPLDDLTNLNKEGITRIKMTADATVINSGIIYLDHFWFSENKTQSSGATAIKTVDSFEDTVNTINYPKYMDRDAEMEISRTAGYSGNGVKIEYNFNSGYWMLITRGMGYNMAEYKGFNFLYAGDLLNCNLEFKVEDTDGVVFIRKFTNFTDTNMEWKKATVRKNELSLFSKGRNNDSTLNLASIKRINFATVKSEDAGIGILGLYALQLMEDEDFEKVREGHIINLISINNNPFSPNGDNIKDFATISYTLSDYADMTFEVYDLAGRRVKKEELGEKSNGTHSDLIWDGTGDDNKVLKNGLYFYKLIAKDFENKEDHITHVIALIK